MKQPKPYLLGVISSLDAIDSYKSDTKDEFLTNPMTQDAILMRLQDIGENLVTLRELFPDFWDEHSTDAWMKAIGLRNIISHAYGEIDLSVIWDLITEDLVSFRHSIASLV